MKIVGLLLLILGAMLSFCASFFATKIKKREATDKEVLNAKLLGLFVAAVGLVIVFIN